MGRKSKTELEEERIVHSLTLYVVFSIAVLLSYTITEQVLSSITGISHDVLTTCIFAAFGGEIFACAFIKIFKIKKEEEHDDIS